MDQKSTKLRILEAGAALIHAKGFNNTGLQEILDKAGVPKGSFYFYFKSKEDFGLQLIDFFVPFFMKTVQKHLDKKDIPSLNRLRNLFEDFRNFFTHVKFKQGCPIGNLSLEMSDQNEVFRKKLCTAFSSMKNEIQKCLAEAAEGGEIGSSMDCGQLSSFILSSWEGALMEMKLTRSAKPLEVFETVIFDVLLNG